MENRIRRVKELAELIDDIQKDCRYVNNKGKVVTEDRATIYKFLVVRGYVEDLGEMTLSEIGTILGVSKESIRQLNTNALNKIKHPNAIRRLKEYAYDNTLDDMQEI